MAISVGTKAPEFTLKTKRGEDLKDVKLSDNFGKKSTSKCIFSRTPKVAPSMINQMKKNRLISSVHM